MSEVQVFGSGRRASVGQNPLQKPQKVIKVLQKHQNKDYPTKNKKAKVF